jgi:peroxidase
MDRITFFTLNIFFSLIIFMEPSSNAQLDYNYYNDSCPNLSMIVGWGVWAAVKNESRMAASILRLHFHDCFVNGCDGSILLDNTDFFVGEKNALPNRNSIRGFEVIDYIKADVERACPSIVSCADILTLAAREAVVLAGGPYWPVYLGRKDGLTASEQAANEQIPSPFEPLDTIAAKFARYNLDLKDVVVLSGAHTIGFAHCLTFKPRLFDFNGSGKPDPTLDVSLLSNLQTTCPMDETNSKLLAPLDVETVYRFDNTYYKNLMTKKGLLESDQALLNDPRTSGMVQYYSMYPYVYYKEFAASMVKLGNIGVLTGQNGQIRMKCGSVNYNNY